MTRATLPIHHAERLTQQLAVWHDELRHPDKALRLEALRAIQEFVEALITQEYVDARPQTTTRPLSPFTRMMARIRSLG